MQPALFPFPRLPAQLRWLPAGRENPKPCPPDREEQRGGDGSVASAVGLWAGGDVWESLCFPSLSFLAFAVFL